VARIDKPIMAAGNAFFAKIIEIPLIDG